MGQGGGEPQAARVSSSRIASPIILHFGKDMSENDMTTRVPFGDGNIVVTLQPGLTNSSNALTAAQIVV